MTRAYAAEINGFMHNGYSALNASRLVRQRRANGETAFVVQTITFDNGRTLETRLDPLEEEDEHADAYAEHQRICGSTHRPRGYRCNLVSPFTYA